MNERVKIVPSAAAELIKEVETLATPLLAAIATARRLAQIAIPASEDGSIGAGLFATAHKIRREYRAAGAAAERFLRELSGLEAAMQKLADAAAWHQRDLGN